MLSFFTFQSELIIPALAVISTLPCLAQNALFLKCLPLYLQLNISTDLPFEFPSQSLPRRKLLCTLSTT